MTPPRDLQHVLKCVWRRLKQNTGTLNLFWQTYKHLCWVLGCSALSSDSWWLCYQKTHQVTPGEEGPTTTTSQLLTNIYRDNTESILCLSVEWWGQQAQEGSTGGRSCCLLDLERCRVTDPAHPCSRAGTSTLFQLIWSHDLDRLEQRPAATGTFVKGFGHPCGSGTLKETLTDSGSTLSLEWWGG